MGRDIHVVLEKKTASGWEFFDPGFTAYDGRHYAFFDFIDEISDPGCPPELNEKKLRLYSETTIVPGGEESKTEYFIWDTTLPKYMYGFGYITLEKLVREAERYNVTWVSTDFVEAFQRLGGVFPEGMHVTAGPFDDGAVGIRVFDEDDLRLRDYIYRGIHDLRLIAEAHQLREDELRICYAFDC